MTRKQLKQLRQTIETLVDDYEIQNGRTHMKVILRKNGITRKIPVSSSPSCPHAINQFERDLRRTVGEMEA